jgi:putative colanic acid biosynthesis UDP-glucose lipid carrier transferase
MGKLGAKIVANFPGRFGFSPGASDASKGSDEVRFAASAGGNFTSQEPSIEPADGVRAQAAADAPVGIRLPISYRGIAGFAASLDLLIIVAAATISGAAYHFAISAPQAEFSRDLAAAVFVAVLFVSATRMRKLYDPSRLTNWNEQLQNIAGAWCGTFLLLASGVFTWGVGKDLSRGTILLFWAVGGGALLAHRAFWRVYLPAALSKGALKGRNAIIISWDNPMTASFASLISHHGYSVIGQFVVSSDLEQSKSAVNSAVTLARGAAVDDIFLIPKNRHAVDVGSVADWLRILPVPVTLVPDPTTAELIRNPWYELGSFLAVEIQRPPLSPTEQGVKRAFDIVVASVALVLLLPLFVAIGIAITLDSRGPVVFRQTRHGFNGVPFKIFKFRSMYVLEDGDIIGQATPGDKRVTRVGAWLRKMSFDELPQLLNVLRGEMSIVGPRPHAAAHDKYFAKCVEKYAIRHHVKSGITGWAQVQGARGETDTLEKIQRRVSLDLWYIDHWSFGLDLSIMVRTVGVVLRGKNAV